MITHSTEILPLMSQRLKLPQGIATASPVAGGQTDLFALLLGTTLMPSADSPAGLPLGELAHNGIRSESLATETSIHTGVTPDPQSEIADPLLAALLASLSPVELKPNSQAAAMLVQTPDVPEGEFSITADSSAARPDGSPVRPGPTACFAASATDQAAALLMDEVNTDSFTPTGTRFTLAIAPEQQPVAPGVSSDVPAVMTGAASESSGAPVASPVAASAQTAVTVLSPNATSVPAPTAEIQSGPIAGQIMQLAVELGLADGLAVVVDGNSPTSVSALAVDSMPISGTGALASSTLMPANTMPASYTPEAMAQALSDTATSSTAAVSDADVSAALSNDDDGSATQSQPQHRSTVRVRVEAAPARVATREQWQQTYVENTQSSEPEDGVVSAVRNSAVEMTSAAESESSLAVSEPLRHRAPVRASIQAVAAPESSQSGAEVGESALPETQLATSQSRSSITAGPNAAIAAQARASGNEMPPTAMPVEYTAQVHSMSQTATAVTAPDPALQAETPEPVRFIVDTPKPLPVPGRIAVRLEPPELGVIRIDLTTGSNGVVGRMRFESEPVRAAVERGFPELHKALADAGVRVERFEIIGHTSGRDVAGVWVADDSGQNAAGERTPNNHTWTNATGERRERSARDGDRRGPAETPAGFTRARGYGILQAGQVNLLA